MCLLSVFCVYFMKMALRKFICDSSFFLFFSSPPCSEKKDTFLCYHTIPYHNIPRYLFFFSFFL